MRWDASKVSTKKVILSEQDTCATNTSSAWTSIQADEFLSEGVHEVVINAMDVDNPSLFVGIAAPEYWDQVAAAMAQGEEALPRDSPHCICMHGDGRCFIKSQEKDWGLMRLASDASLVLVLDFVQAQVSFKVRSFFRFRTLPVTTRCVYQRGGPVDARARSCRAQFAVGIRRPSPRSPGSSPPRPSSRALVVATSSSPSPRAARRARSTGRTRRRKR